MPGNMNNNNPPPTKTDRPPRGLYSLCGGRLFHALTASDAVYRFISLVLSEPSADVTFIM